MKIKKARTSKGPRPCRPGPGCDSAVKHHPHNAPSEDRDKGTTTALETPRDIDAPLLGRLFEAPGNKTGLLHLVSQHNEPPRHWNEHVDR